MHAANGVSQAAASLALVRRACFGHERIWRATPEKDVPITHK
jgi:hypothetical protein